MVALGNEVYGCAVIAGLIGKSARDDSLLRVTLPSLSESHNFGSNYSYRLYTKLYPKLNLLSLVL
jgi:hypothetical protein